MNAPRSRGFTLIEVLIALALFALVSGVAYRGLSAVLDARQRLAAETLKWRNLNTAFALMGQAVANSVDRSVLDADNRLTASFMGWDLPRQGDRQGDHLLFELTRTGFPGRSGALVDLQRVGFALNDGRLEQFLWPVLDRAPRSRPGRTTLLDAVQEAEVRFLDHEGAWHPTWPRRDHNEPLPAAVGLSLRLTSGEQLARIFPLR